MNIQKKNAFICAFNGIKRSISSEINLKIHFAITLIVLIAGILLHITAIEWCFIFLAIGATISLELLNTSIEKLSDIVNPEYDKTIGFVKDIAAGAVLVMAICSVIIGLLIFLPKLSEL